MVRTKFPVAIQPSQQQLLALRIKRLKNLIDVDIEFDENKPLTAILGPNGFGKSSILHALVASFTPPIMRAGEDYRFTDFFPNTPHGYWAGTDFTVAHRYRVGEIVSNVTTNVRKETSQWLPLQKSLPKREVYYIGVNSAVPKIEVQRTRLRISYVTSELTDDNSLEIRQKSGLVFNRDYTKYHTNEVSRNKKFIGVEYRGVNFSALSMGAGEQRVFKILKTVVMAGNYSLVLIDEIDLLLHGDALTRLFKILNEYAADKKMQIIFTTHREQVLEFEDIIAVRHIYQTQRAPHKTFCFNETKPDAITRLTGQQSKPLRIACEDSVAEAIIEKIANQVGLGKFVDITKYGAAINSFTLAAALILGGEDLSNSLFVLDGDEYETVDKKRDRIGKVLTGTEVDANDRRDKVFNSICQFAPNLIQGPEQSLHSMVTSVEKSGDHDKDDIIDAATQIACVQDNHDWVNKIIESLGCRRDVGLMRIVSVASCSGDWVKYVAPIREWLEAKSHSVREHV